MVRSGDDITDDPSIVIASQRVARTRARSAKQSIAREKEWMASSQELAMTTDSLRYRFRPQCCDDRIEPIRQRGRTGLQDQRRFDLDDAVVTDGGDLAPARPFPDLVRHDLFTTPRRQDHIGRSSAHDIRQNGAILRGLLKPQFRQNIFAARNLDQFRDPADAADQGIVPFLEIDFWLWRGPGYRRDVREAFLIAGCELISALGCTDQRADGADHRQDAGDVALVKNMNR